MKKILILCLFLFGCDGVGVFSHGHAKGICIYIDEVSNEETCLYNYTENDCVSESDSYSSPSGNKYHVWYSTNLTCSEWKNSN